MRVAIDFTGDPLLAKQIILMISWMDGYSIWLHEQTQERSDRAIATGQQSANSNFLSQRNTREKRRKHKNRTKRRKEWTEDRKKTEKTKREEGEIPLTERDHSDMAKFLTRNGIMKQNNKDKMKQEIIGKV